MCGGPPCHAIPWWPPPFPPVPLFCAVCAASPQPRPTRPAPSAPPPAGRAPGGQAPGKGGESAAAAAAKKAKWKAQSEQLRAAMRANKQIAEAQARGEDIRHIKIDAGPEPEDDR